MKARKARAKPPTRLQVSWTLVKEEPRIAILFWFFILAAAAIRLDKLQDVAGALEEFEKALDAFFAGGTALDAAGRTRALEAFRGIDEILTVTRLGLPKELRRSLACTNIIENVMGTVRRVCRNVKRWRSASMAMRWTAAAMREAAKGFRRLKAHKQLPALRAALEAHQTRNSTRGVLARQANAA